MAKCPPIFLTSSTDKGRKLTRIEAKPGGDTSEGWLQRLLYQHPDLLPVDEFDESYASAVAMARELPTKRGRIDLLYVSPFGGLVLIETKLWKNPEKHRVVVAQIIDYAKELVTWDYEGLCDAVLAASRSHGETTALGLEDRIRPHLETNGTDLTEFQENVAENLRTGTFLLLIVGDRISPNIALMTNAIQSAPGLNFTIELVEMKIYRQTEDTDWPLLVVPDIVGRTLEKVRHTVQIHYKQERPRVEVEGEEGEGETLRHGILGMELFLESVPKDLRATYESGMEKWKQLGGSLRPSAKVLYWEMNLGGEPRKIFGTNPRSVNLVRRLYFEQWASNVKLYEEYIKRLEKSPAAAQVAHAGKAFVRHEKLTPTDLAVVLDAGMWLADAVRNEEQQGS